MYHRIERWARGKWIIKTPVLLEKTLPRHLEVNYKRDFRTQWLFIDD